MGKQIIIEMTDYFTLVKEKIANFYCDDELCRQIAGEYGKENHACFLKYGNAVVYKSDQNSFGLNCQLWSMATTFKDYSIKYLIKIVNRNDRVRNKHLQFGDKNYIEDKSTEHEKITEENGSYSDLVYCLSNEERKIFCFKDCIAQPTIEGDMYFMIVIVDDKNKIRDLSEVQLCVSDAISELKNNEAEYVRMDIKKVFTNHKFIGSDFYQVTNFE